MANSDSLEWAETGWTVESIGNLFSSDHVRVQLRLPETYRDEKLYVRAGNVDQLARVSFPPWYWNGQQLVDFDALGAKPKSFAELLEVRTQDLPINRAPSGGLVVPAVILPEGEALMIDGNHRFLAKLIHEPDSCVVQVGLPGLSDIEYLPDLPHWLTV